MARPVSVKHIACAVGIGVAFPAARGVLAHELGLILPAARYHSVALRALLGGARGGHLGQGAAPVGELVRQEFHSPSPGLAEDGAVQARLLRDLLARCLDATPGGFGHVRDVQCFDDHRAVRFREGGGGFVLPVVASALGCRAETSDLVVRGVQAATGALTLLPGLLTAGGPLLEVQQPGFLPLAERRTGPAGW